jgi:hypothetical protein
MLYDSIEEELWRIFTFYGLHGDAHQPTLLRPASFVRFCKDTQIISKKLTSTFVETKITQLVKI